MSRFASAFSHHFRRRGIFSPSSLQQMADALPRGSATKWAELLAEEVSLANGHPPQCTASAKAWFDDYAAKHGQIVAAAARGQGFGRSKFITYICQAGINCGGLGDRLLGMTSAFLYALVTGRAFHTEWQSPIPIEAVFDSPWIDWSFSSFGNWTPALLRDDDMLDSARELDLIHYSAPEMDDAFGTRSWDAELPAELTPHYEDRDLAFAAPWIQLFNNRGFVYRSFSYEPVRQRLHDLGLQPHSAFSCILSYLFEPKPSARDFIQRYTSIFSLPSVFSVGIQIRTGDTSMKDAEYDKVNTVELHNSFFQCASELAEEYATPEQKIVYFLVTDSQHLRKDAAARFGDTIVTSGLGIEHVHQRSGHVDGVQNAVIEECVTPLASQCLSSLKLGDQVDPRKDRLPRHHPKFRLRQARQPGRGQAELDRDPVPDEQPRHRRPHDSGGAPAARLPQGQRLHELRAACFRECLPSRLQIGLIPHAPQEWSLA